MYIPHTTPEAEKRALKTQFTLLESAFDSAVLVKVASNVSASSRRPALSPACTSCSNSPNITALDGGKRQSNITGIELFIPLKGHLCVCVTYR